MDESSTHCLHIVGGEPLRRPPTYLHICCQCGLQRLTRGVLRRPEGHGPYLPHDYSEEIYETPWDDVCVRPETTEITSQELSDESSSEYTGTDGQSQDGDDVELESRRTPRKSEVNKSS